MSRPTFLSVSRAAALCLAGTLSACGDDLELTPAPPNGTHVSHVSNADGSITTVVDATSKEAWIGLDLDTGEQVSAAQDAVWDLSFQRFGVRSRGGVNGKGGVEVAVLPAQDFTKLTQAPVSGYSVDADDGDDEGTDPDTVFQANGGWYAYDVASHKLTARQQVYVVRSDSKAYFKVEMLSYYDDAGTPAMLKLRWAKVSAPASGSSLDGAEAHASSVEASR
ncbi:HmuY family protein [Myxococcus stipitatus]|uniref:HmuY family protein n=1 Tax=Myxococcus stipitatus TaxID=83455 RepID=UPI003145291E